MNLDTRYAFHLALDISAAGVFMAVSGLYCLAEGMTLQQLGWFFAAFFIVMVVLEVPSGFLADRFGHLAVYRLAKGFDMLNFVLLVLAPSITTVIIASAIGGIGRALGSGCLEAWYVNQRYKEGRHANIKAALSRANLWLLSGLGIGAAIGGLLPAQVPYTFSQAYLNGNPYKVALILSMAIHFAALGISFLTFHEGENVQSRKDHKHESLLSMGSNLLSHFMANPVLIMLLAWQMLMGYALANHSVYWQPVFAMLEGGNSMLEWVGFIVASNYLLAALLGRLLGASANSFSAVAILPAYTVCAATALIGMSLVSNPWGFLLANWVFISAVFLSRPVVAAELHRHVGSSYRSASVSLLSLSLNLGGVMTGGLLSWLTQIFSVPVAWQVSALVMTLSACGLSVWQAMAGRGRQAPGNETD
ncbi:MFS transporter [Photobacterium sp. SP02]|uniref:MFS transporter n=1 Tax=Photobacterium sp. SP02 TaxID=3032280 RepID=UPI0031456080